MVARFMFGPFELRFAAFHVEGSELGARISLSEDKGEGGDAKIPSFKSLKTGQIPASPKLAAGRGGQPRDYS